MNTHPLDNRIPPPLLMLALGLLMWFGAGAPPPLGLPRVVGGGLAAALGGIGIAFNVAGFRTIRSAGSTIDPTRPDAASALVTGGPFRLSRNPMYVGFALMLLAWAIYLGSAWTLLGPTVFVAYLTRFQIVPEERALALKFGTAFEQYAAQVRRWI